MESAKQYKYTYDDMAIKSPHLHVKHVLHERPVPVSAQWHHGCGSDRLRLPSQRPCLLHDLFSEIRAEGPLGYHIHAVTKQRFQILFEPHEVEKISSLL